jgi:flagellar hook-basal body complex protein FliE
VTLEAIGAIGALPGLDALPAGATVDKPAAGFGAWFAQQVGQVDAGLRVADNDMRALAVGNVQNLHEVMIHLEEAKLSFQLLAQVRNRVLEAYQEVMRTQV